MAAGSSAKTVRGKNGKSRVVAAAPRAEKVVRKPAADQGPTRDEIARRAYEIYEASGRIDGRDEQNWLQAEQELLADG